MNSGSCSIAPKDDGKRYIINCAGDKVPVADTGFTARCAIGNTDDYLKSFKHHINSEIVSLGEPPLISVVVPSYASSEQALSWVLTSLCSQEYPVPAEILVFINEPQNALENIRSINDRNEKFVFSFEKSALSNSSSNIRLRCLRQVVSGGLAGVYQVVTASSIARIRAFCDRVMADHGRPEKIKSIEKYLQHSMLLLCDDDMEISDRQAVARAYKHAVSNDAVILGQLYITRVDTVEKYALVLCDLMQLFLELKYDHGLNFLSPRGTLLSNILRVDGVNIGQPFADQVFFASIATGKEQYLLDARTSIGESDHPGNGNFLKKLRLYLEGEDNDALDIFGNVLKRYQEDDHKGKYCAADIERLILSIRTRDIGNIFSTASELLASNT